MKIHSMLPYLDKKEIDSLIDDALAKKINLKLPALLPFADEEKIDNVIDRALNDDSVLVYISHLMPFCNQRQMDILYDAYQNDLIKRGESCEEEILPYLSKDKIKEVFENQMKKMKLEVKEGFKNAIEEIKNNK